MMLEKAKKEKGNEKQEDEKYIVMGVRLLVSFLKTFLLEVQVVVDVVNVVHVLIMDHYVVLVVGIKLIYLYDKNNDKYKNTIETIRSNYPLENYIELKEVLNLAMECLSEKLI